MPIITERHRKAVESSEGSDPTLRFPSMSSWSSAALIALIVAINAHAVNISLRGAVEKAISKKKASCVFVDVQSDAVITSDSSSVLTRYTPCSTFKIWNTLIGIDCRIIESAQAHFYGWDSIPRFLPAWNRDLTLKEAFQVSCVPAYQILARGIGHERMQNWITTLNYGDKDMSSGIDDFWLPREGKKSIKISPLEQAQLIKKLLNGGFPFSEKSKAILQEVMMTEKTEKGTLYGKTGSGAGFDGKKEESIGWFVGYIASKDRTYSFACLVQGESVSGRDSKGLVESILRSSDLL